jgi:hypothetical protein
VRATARASAIESANGWLASSTKARNSSRVNGRGSWNTVTSRYSSHAHRAHLPVAHHLVVPVLELGVEPKRAAAAARCSRSQPLVPSTPPMSKKTCVMRGMLTGGTMSPEIVTGAPRG